MGDISKDTNQRASGQTSDAEVARGGVAAAILDGVGSQLTQRPMADVTMADLAAAAGVSRQTVYNTFGSRGALVSAYAHRELDRLAAVVETVFEERAASPHDALRTAIETVVATVEQHPMVVARASGSEELLALFTTREGVVLDGFTERLAQVARRHWPAPGLDVLADGIVRLTISYILSGPLSPGDIADRVAEFIGPAVDVKVAEAARLRADTAPPRNR